jgi:hypothetical protein
MVLPLEGWSGGGSVMMTTPWSCGWYSPTWGGGGGGGGGGGAISGEIPAALSGEAGGVRGGGVGEPSEARGGV